MKKIEDWEIKITNKKISLRMIIRIKVTDWHTN